MLALRFGQLVVLAVDHDAGRNELDRGFGERGSRSEQGGGEDDLHGSQPAPTAREADSAAA